ncbi:hypothetical protein BP6252_10221 [Coleophoma cylindrospora]|uniref:Xylanolytic transcriptional activator regulatory domain-containing protein n=1 Tax=Coleophoma cylindrospora TaxID=1849047 RepID=A0A3D8QXS0_9HELO|nr:hypothetical protein BP6252_10221 [Coleophoma cylindrospora]
MLPECELCIAAGVDCVPVTDDSSSNTDRGAHPSWMEDPLIQQTSTGWQPFGPLSPGDIPTNDVVATVTELGVPLLASSRLPYSPSPSTSGSIDDASTTVSRRRALSDVISTDNQIAPELLRPRSVPRDVQALRAARTRDILRAYDSMVGYALIDAYFRDAHRSCPFLDKKTVLATLESETNRDYFVDAAAGTSNDSCLTILHLVMAIGYGTLQRTSQLPAGAGPRLNVESEAIISESLLSDDIETVQILLLLTIYIQFDMESEIKVQILVDMVARRVMNLGLTRRSVVDDQISPAEMERNHRLFWSVFCIDRLVATSMGMPVALNGVNMRVLLPRMTVDEFASDDSAEVIATLQVSRHVIQLRQLEDKVLHQIHLRDHQTTSYLPTSDRQEIIENLRVEIDDWYSNGCLLKSTGSDEMSIYIRIPWLGARYYNLLLLLYYPSYFKPKMTPLTRHELVSLAQKHISANFVRFQQHQLPLSHLMLCRLFPVCLVFLHNFMPHGLDQTPMAIHNEITMCADIMAVFPSRWVQAHRAATLLRELARRTKRYVNSVLSIDLSDSRCPVLSASSKLSEDEYSWYQTTRASFIELMEQVLGKGSTYIPLREWEISEVEGLNRTPIRARAVLESSEYFKE